MSKIAMHFGEVVLKTSQYDALKSWYSQVLDTKPIFESERRGDLGPGAMRQMCTIRPYSEFPFTATLVILDFAELRQNDQTVSGMDPGCAKTAGREVSTGHECLRCRSQ